MEEGKLVPQQGPQWTFLSTKADVAIYGGAAGGGKTWALLVEPLRNIENPRFGAVIFRQTYKQIRDEGGLWDESQEIYGNLDGISARPYPQSCVWQFDTGARISFSYLRYDEDVNNYKGAQIPFIGFDQLEDHTEKQFFYMLSRNRSKCGVIPYVRATCNPKPDSWLSHLLQWWWDPDTGYAIPERSGVVRYFFRTPQGEIDWGDTKREIIERNHNTFHMLSETTGFAPEIFVKSFTFIAANVYDNKVLLQANPQYLANLMSLDHVSREQLLHGNWKVRPEAGKVFNRAWFGIVPAAPAGGITCRFWDFAATEKKMAKDDPDFTAGVKIRHVDGIWYVMDCEDFQEGPTETDKRFKNIIQQDVAESRRQNTTYLSRWEYEPGSSGKRENVRLMQMVATIVADAKGVRPTGSKIERARGLAAQAEAGNVKLVEGDWNEHWLTHMHHQPDWDHNDIMDGGSGSYNSIVDYMNEQLQKGSAGSVQKKTEEEQAAADPNHYVTLKYLGQRAFILPIQGGGSWSVSEGWEKLVERDLGTTIANRFPQFFTVEGE